MIQAVHLLGLDADFQTRQLAGLLAEGGGVTIGHGGDHPDVPSTARWLKRRRPAPVIHAWGFKALLSASMANLGPIIFTPQLPVTPTAAKWLLKIYRKRNVHFVCPNAALRSALCLRGVAPDKCHVILPGASAANSVSRAEARTALNLTDADFAVLAPGESTHSAGHALSLWTVAILHELSPGWKLLVWGRGPKAAALRSMARRLGRPQLLRRCNLWEFSDLLPAADAALVTGDADAAMLPIAMCMAAGLPMVSTPREPLEDRRNALLAADRAPRTLSQRLLELRTNAELRRTLSEAARADAARLFNADEFKQRHSELYERVMEKN
jgi:glycosyltransferase involved in cell wall biosynthesis